MNYAQARQLGDKSGWHFTVRNDMDIWVHACCRNPGPPATEDDVERYGYQLGDPTLGLAHEPHATAEEAEACFNSWRRDPDHVRLDGAWGDWTGCEICDAPTKRAAIIKDIGGPNYVSLCEEHLTVENAISTIKDATQVMYS